MDLMLCLGDIPELDLTFDEDLSDVELPQVRLEAGE